MKLKFSHFCVLVVIILSSISCGSSKKGCGLTSDATPIQPNETEVLAKAVSK